MAERLELEKRLKKASAQTRARGASVKCRAPSKRAPLKGGMVYSIWYMVYSIWYMVYSIWYRIDGIWLSL